LLLILLLILWTQTRPRIVVAHVAISTPAYPDQSAELLQLVREIHAGVFMPPCSGTIH